MTRFAHALFGILPAWRRLCDPHLPPWGFHRQRFRLPRVEALRAELRCGLCDTRARCRSRIARGRTGPVAGCPNASLFAIR
jgi:hypothetical protein